MSEQPLFTVVATIRSVSIAQRDDKGIYRIAMQMQYPFDRPETAAKLCDYLNGIDVPLMVPGEK